jgi:hypothetical protein
MTEAGRSPSRAARLPTAKSSPSSTSLAARWVAGDSTPGLLPESWSPGLNACTSDFEASQNPVRPYAPERLLFGYASTSPTTFSTPVVVCSELPNNHGGSITNSAETIAAGVIWANELPTPLVWVEHWPEESTEGDETFELVVFSSYEVVDRAPCLGETRAWIGEPTWKTLDRASVELLVGESVGRAVPAGSSGFLSAATPSI